MTRTYPLARTEVTGYVGTFDYSADDGVLTRQFAFAVTVEKHAPLVLTEHDASAWADRTELPGMSDETRALLTR